MSGLAPGMTTLAVALVDALAQVPEDFPGEPKNGHHLDALKALDDADVRKLLYLIEEEGLRRGWGSWWWE